MTRSGRSEARHQRVGEPAGTHDDPNLDFVDELPGQEFANLKADFRLWSLNLQVGATG